MDPLHPVISAPSTFSHSTAPRWLRRLTLLSERYASWIGKHDLPFLVSSIGMIVMLLWAGAYKMTVPGADGIVPLVMHSPLMKWQFKVFGPYLGADLIGATEWTSAFLLLIGYRWPVFGILGSTMTSIMFFITSSMLITTPGTLIAVNGMRYMNDLGLFLYKDIISLGTSLFLIVRYGQKQHLRA